MRSLPDGLCMVLRHSGRRQIRRDHAPRTRACSASIPTPRRPSFLAPADAVAATLPARTGAASSRARAVRARLQPAICATARRQPSQLPMPAEKAAFCQRRRGRMASRSGGLVCRAVGTMGGVVAMHRRHVAVELPTSPTNPRTRPPAQHGSPMHTALTYQPANA